MIFPYVCRAMAGRKLDLREARKQIKVIEKEIEEKDVKVPNL